MVTSRAERLINESTNVVAAKAERPGGVVSVSSGRSAARRAAARTRWGRVGGALRTERSRVREDPEGGVGGETVGGRGLGVVVTAVRVAFLNFDVAHG